MNIGALDRYIVIQTPTNVTSSTTGERTQTWATLCSVYATMTYPHMEFISKEDNENGRETSTTTVNFTIWYRTDILEGMRILFESEYFDIMRINRVGQRDEMLKLVTQVKY